MRTGTWRHGWPRGRRAAAALEFALTGAMLIGVIGFLTDLGFVLYTQVALDFVASRVARQLAVDSRQTLSASPAGFQSLAVCPLLAAFLACDQVTVALTPVTDYANGAIPTTGAPPFNAGQGGSLMLLQLSYALPVFATPLAAEGVFAGTATVTQFPYINEY
jgi:Flp pilus assembly protein TadG